MAVQRTVVLLACVAVAAFATCASAQTPAKKGEVDCKSITGCSECIPVAYNVKEAALKFQALKAARAEAKAARLTAAAARAANKKAAPVGKAPGRLLLEADDADVITGVEGLPADTAVAPSCSTCMEGFALVTKSVRGRPPMGRCECAAGYGIEYSTISKLNKNGATKLKRTFTCTMCGPNSVPLTPAAGVKVTNSGVVMIQEPLVPVTEGAVIPRKDWLPATAAKRFALVPGQCVECPAGSVKSVDGMTCEAAA